MSFEGWQFRLTISVRSENMQMTVVGTTSPKSEDTAKPAEP